MSAILSLLIIIAYIALLLLFLHGAVRLVLKGEMLLFLLSCILPIFFLLGFTGQGKEGSPWRNGYRTKGTVVPTGIEQTVTSPTE